MSHPDEGVLQELLDGELPPADAAAVRAHLAGCVACALTVRDLGTIQAEADAIVSRLPLDPPLVVPAVRARPRRLINLRLLGLAASAVLVAGTSWVLLRSSPDVAARLPARDEAASGIVLPMPNPEREELPAATPAAPAAPAAPGRADQERKKISDPFETRSLAPAPAPAPQMQAKAKEEDLAAAKDGQAAGPAQPSAGEKAVANAARARLAAPAPASPLTVTPGVATDQLGGKFLTIQGLEPLSVEIVGSQADSSEAVVQHYVVNGTPVLLTQRRSPVTMRGWREADSSEQVTTARNMRVWNSGGILLQLEAALPGDSLDALRRRVK